MRFRLYAQLTLFAVVAGVSLFGGWQHATTAFGYLRAMRSTLDTRPEVNVARTDMLRDGLYQANRDIPASRYPHTVLLVVTGACNSCDKAISAWQSWVSTKTDVELLVAVGDDPSVERVRRSVNTGVGQRTTVVGVKSIELFRAITGIVGVPTAALVTADRFVRGLVVGPPTPEAFQALADGLKTAWSERTPTLMFVGSHSQPLIPEPVSIRSTEK